MFSEKLAFIMNITNTTASALGKACHLDSSHISRLKSGSRALPKNPAFLSDMCGFLSKRITESYQEKAVMERLGLFEWPSSAEGGSVLLMKWFSSPDDKASDIPLSPIMAAFQGEGSDPGQGLSSMHGARPPKQYYYGPEGKRQAVLAFFDLIQKQPSPVTLLLSSEEDMEWLYGDQIFSAQWTDAFRRILMMGNRVKIVHNIGRDINEMLEAISKWIPVYVTGMIEPYYYPRLRDEVFQRTLFIAPGCAAVVSNSVNKKSEGMLNELVTDISAVRALQAEYDNYLSLCRPLMRIFTAEESSDMWKALERLAREDGDMILMSDMPALSTMPEEVARAMQSRAPESRIFEQWQTVSRFIRNITGERSYTEILPETFALPADGNVPLPCADLLNAPGLAYTKEEWQSHLQNTALFAQKRKDYTQVKIPSVPANMFLFAKEGRGVLMVRNAAPNISFAFTESGVSAACWDFLKRKLSAR